MKKEIFMSRVKLVLISCFVFISSYAFSDDSITMTTYYPAPNGDYTTLKSDVLTIRGSANPSVVGSLTILNGKVGIGMTPGNSSEKFEVSGNIKSAGNIIASGTLPDTGHIDAVAFYYSSDERLKENVATISEGLEKVLALRGVSFNFKNSPDQKRIGLIAQEVEKVVPEVVQTGTDGYKSVEYGNLVAVLIEAVKSQQAEIDLLKKRLEALEGIR